MFVFKERTPQYSNRKVMIKARVVPSSILAVYSRRVSKPAESIFWTWSKSSTELAQFEGGHRDWFSELEIISEADLCDINGRRGCRWTAFIVFHDMTGEKHSEVIKIKMVTLILWWKSQSFFLMLYWLIMLKLNVVVLNPGVLHKPPPRTESGTLLCLSGQCWRSDLPFRHTGNQ